MEPRNSDAESDSGKTGRGVVSIAGAGFFFSLNTSLARISYNGGGNPVTLVFLRAVVATIGISVLMLSGKRTFSLPRSAILPLSAVSLFVSLQSICYLTSIAFIPVGLAALLFYTFPLMVALANRFIDGVTIGTPRAISFTIAFAGIALAIGPSFEQLDWRGIALALLAALANMLAFRAAAAALRHSSSVAVSFYGNLGCLPLLGLGLIFLGGFQTPNSLTGWSALTAVGVSYTLAMLFHFAGIRLIGTTHASLIYNLEPIFSIVAAAILLGERLSPLQYLGGGIVVVALIASDVLSSKKRA